MRHQAGPIGPAFHQATTAAAVIADRLRHRDPTLWDHGGAELTSWLEAPAASQAAARGLTALADRLVADGVTDVVLVGMGSAVTYARVLVDHVEAPRMRLHVCDTTHPDAVARWRALLASRRWALVVASRSGTTVETTVLRDRFWADLLEAVGPAAAAARTVVVTTGDSELAAWATAHGVDAIVSVPAGHPGRYASLTALGMLPAALLGLNLQDHLAPALALAEAFTHMSDVAREASELGAFIAAGAQAHRHLLTVILPPALVSAGPLLHHLVSESCADSEQGVVAVTNEPVLEPVAYGPNRMVVAIGAHHGLQAVADAGIPVAQLDDADADSLAALVLRWQWATVVAGTILHASPLSETVPSKAAALATRVLQTGGTIPTHEPADDLVEHLAQAERLALVAWVDPKGLTAARLPEAVRTLRRRFGVPVTLGIGPSDVHNAGRTHEQGPGDVAVAVLVDQPTATVTIPGRDIDFGALFAGQVAGQVAALRQQGRPVAVVSLAALLEA